MPRPVEIAAAVILPLLVGFGAVTWAALEVSDVAVLETRDPDGGARRTRVWFAEHGGAIWLEAATPAREWLHDVQRAPRVTLERGDDLESFDASPLAGEASHEEIRALLRAKYGWRDRWVGLLQDTSQSVAVRLVAVPR
jgi:hypothetical protein